MTDTTCRAALADERAKFEAWLKDKHGVSKKSNPWPVWVDENDGTYVYSQEEWEAWQGRAALAQEGQTDEARILDWLLTEVPSGRADRPATIGRTIDKNATAALLTFRAWCSPAEAREAMRAAALASAPQPQDPKGQT